MRILIFTVAMVAMISLTSSVCIAQETSMGAPPVAAKQAPGELEQMRQSLKKLTTENERLRTKVAELENRLKNHAIRDRMMQEEQRAEGLEEQLFSIAKEEANLQRQMDDVNEQLRPENIDQLQVMGSLRPEEVRESTRRKLTNEQMRIQAQLQLLQQNRTRLQSSVSVTDMLIQNLRMQLQAASRQ